MIENVDYIICPICKQKCKQKCRQITIQHIRMHGINDTKEFLEKYPKQRIVCDITRGKIKKTLKNYMQTDTHKLNTSKAMKEFRKTLSIERLNEISKKISLKKKGISGKKQSMKTIENRVKKLIGKKRSQESKINMKNAQNKPEQRIKLRQKAVERILLNNGKFPAYNKKSIEVFKEFDEINKIKGQYATSPNEFYVSELRYWLDYINFEKKLIIEVDESRHFDKLTGLLREKDLIRENEIREKFPDFKFLRFKNQEMCDVLKIKIGEVK